MSGTFHGMGTLLTFGLALTVAFGSTMNAQSSSDKDVAARFVGAWRLVTWTERLADGTTRPAATDVGYLMFADGGRMCAVLSSSKRAPWQGAARTIEDAVARSTGFISYCAQFDVPAE